MQQQEEWVVAFASVQGNGHVAENLPCQDSCLLKPLESGWGIAAVADGAGSASHADEGAELAVSAAVDLFEKKVYAHNWIAEDSLPADSNWAELALDTFKEIYDGMEAHAASQLITPASLACTLIVVIYTPNGLMAAHIGDGRAGYADGEGHWHALIYPTKGEEANETIFLTSDIWESGDARELIEAQVIRQPVNAFSLLTDGCEKASFECNLYDVESGQYYDPNRPYDRFFDPNIKALLKLRAEGKSQLEINELWENFLNNGNDRFRNEMDDKTMILAVRADT